MNRAPPGVVQTKLEVGRSDDPLEREADRVADVVMRDDATVRRMCPECEEDAAVRRQPVEDEEPEELVHRAGARTGGATASGAIPLSPSLAARVQGGKPLSQGVRAAFEPRLGHHLGDVRIHRDAAAGETASALSARAYTIGHDIAFASGQYRPETAAGRRLLAHELVHTIQQDKDASKIQRFVDCTPVTMAGPRCPPREPGEIRESRTQGMILDKVTLASPGVPNLGGGWIVANFAVGSSKIKAGLEKTPKWPLMIDDITKGANKGWEILGFSDCSGADDLNRTLRSARATSMYDFLPAAAQNQVDDARGEFIGSCVADNRSKGGRSFNRSVLILHKVTEVDIPAESVPPSKWPTPKPEAPPTADCAPAQEQALARAHPLAGEMVVRALAVLNGPSSAHRSALLTRHFGDDSTSTELRLLTAYRRILRGFRSDVKFECEQQSHPLCGPTTHGFVIPLVGFRLHICGHGFKCGDEELADTIIHESAHMFAFEFIHPETDHIAEFAAEAHSRLGPVR